MSYIFCHILTCKEAKSARTHICTSAAWPKALDTCSEAILTASFHFSLPIHFL